MPALVKCQPLPDGTKQFVFCTKEDGGHGDLIGGPEAFDEFLRQAMGLAASEQTLYGLQLEKIAATVPRLVTLRME